MDITRIPRVPSRWLIVVALAIVACLAMVFAALVFFVPRGESASAAGDDRTKVAEATFTVNVEPIKVEIQVEEGYPYQMNPGNKAILGALISNLSSTDWEVEVEIVPNLASPYESDLVSISARWGDGTLFMPGQTVVVPGMATRKLAITIIAHDGAGTEGIQISVYRLPKAEPVPTPVTPNLQNSH